MITESILSKLEALHAASTPDVLSTNEFLKAAHNHLPDLIAEVRRLKEIERDVAFDPRVRELCDDKYSLMTKNTALKAEVERLQRAVSLLTEQRDREITLHCELRYRDRSPSERDKIIAMAIELRNAAIGESK